MYVLVCTPQATQQFRNAVKMAVKDTVNEKNGSRQSNKRCFILHGVVLFMGAAILRSHEYYSFSLSNA